MSAPATSLLENALADERTLLGALLLSPVAFPVVDGEEGVRPEHFASKRAGAVYAAMRSLHDADGTFDRATVRSTLAQTNQLGEVGAYLDDLVMTPVTAAGNWRRHAKNVRVAATRRALRTIFTEGLHLLDSPAPNDDVVQGAEQALMNVTRGTGAGTGYDHIGRILEDETEHLHKLSTGEVQITGLRSGFRDLDELTGGFQPGELIIVAARPGMGKSAFVTNIAEYCALHGSGVALSSMEMSKRSVAHRLMAARTHISATRLRRGQVKAHRWPGIMQSNAQLALAPLWVDDTRDHSISEIRAKARRLAGRNDLGLLVVDYLQLIRAEQQWGSNRTAAVSDISRGLKVIAGELDIPVIALSQLSRQVESRPDKHPMLSDLRETGAIEQDADVVMFLYREEYYDTDTIDENKGVAEVIVAKNRDGALETITLGFDGPSTRFFNLDAAGPPASAKPGMPF